jgi:hypothetical protein
MIGGLAFGVQFASAAPMSTPNQSLQTQSMTEQVQYRSCRHRHRVCRDRHGGGRDFRRCMRRAGC